MNRIDMTLEEAIGRLETLIEGMDLPAMLGDAWAVKLGINALEARSSHTPARDKLTSKELEVLQYAANGLTRKATALKMGITVGTIRNHRAAILTRLAADNIAQAVAIAFGAIVE